MNKSYCLGCLGLIILVAFSMATASAQQYDIVLRGGHVIDPGNGIDARMDIAVLGDRIAAVQPNILAAQARKVVDVSSLYVVPGLVDLHMHVFGVCGSIHWMRPRSLRARPPSWMRAAAGSRTFEEFRRTVIANSKFERWCC